MRIKVSNRVPGTYDPGVFAGLLRQIEDQLNLLSEGVLQAATNATTSVPTTGVYRVGDFVRNLTPAEAGGAGSKYIIIGWVCSASSPLAFKEARVLTGN